MERESTPTPVETVRKEMDLSREAFARQLGVSYVTVEKWERRERFPSRTNRARLGLLTGRPASFFDEEVVAA